jgi:hypothetical protein
MDFEQRAMGQMPPVMSNMQFPHPAHISTQTPGSTAAPKNFVLTPGNTKTDSSF